MTTGKGVGSAGPVVAVVAAVGEGKPPVRAGTDYKGILSPQDIRKSQQEAQRRMEGRDAVILAAGRANESGRAEQEESWRAYQEAQRKLVEAERAEKARMQSQQLISGALGLVQTGLGLFFKV